MKEIKIIPFVLSILGLVALGHATIEMVGTPQFTLFYAILFIYLLIIFVVILLLSIGALNKETKIEW